MVTIRKNRYHGKYDFTNLCISPPTFPLKTVQQSIGSDQPKMRTQRGKVDVPFSFSIENAP